mmetsp:Transcript_27932/g.34704  ORF Transcript_27932/g.34704 Transcript_27932/m.34704 type:complete len:152 (+) Transcript_27932:659-1114(+)|eukprot:CAMPEP_0170463000 /NCGR_PEP_ID=MMETSP0123-20130129/8277_1 /TAXON_ID=182087 /ORGANISM="Favella ehrenbergii, Strain Fehren 1" /LENGTH=151 /DNA_ID=CAMNT_0010728325 /DNA_START=654 /DNA_END=1109 /DNA_ORIENTATION=-
MQKDLTDRFPASKAYEAPTPHANGQAEGMKHSIFEKRQAKAFAKARQTSANGVGSVKQHAKVQEVSKEASSRLIKICEKTDYHSIPMEKGDDQMNLTEQGKSLNIVNNITNNYIYLKKGKPVNLSAPLEPQQKAALALAVEKDATAAAFGA